MREYRTPGSVRGAGGNPRPYRDRRHSDERVRGDAMPGWKKRSDDEIRELAQEVLAGHILGTWHFETWPERAKTFPDFK